MKDSVVLRHGDCLDVMAKIPTSYVDMILCDLPYGTTNCKWDVIIPLEQMWEQYWRILKDTGIVVLTATNPFASLLISSQMKHFKYDWVWRKNMGSNFASAKYQPMRYHEMVLIFYRNRGTYNAQRTERNSEASKKVCKRPVSSGVKGEQFSDRGLDAVKVQYDSETKGPETVLDFPCVPNGGGKKLHPTQKPTSLMEYLIRTYTNVDEIVLDNCMGSGTTGIACINTNRKFIGIEKDAKYFDIAKKRIEEHNVPGRSD